ncbi:MAG: carboxypeptidase regulatory-like domain-containing protein [Candidatus Cloacimonadales bacterium]|nr:carboxypeptidase regulatory-like domain-containing protein [Candidatus Cloacimonadales bacterium]
MNHKLCLYLVLFIFVVSTLNLGAEPNLQKEFQFRKNLQDLYQHSGNTTLPSIPKWLSGNSDDVIYQKSNHPQHTSSRDVMDVKVNGLDQTTIVQGEVIIVTIYFSDNCFTAETSIWADMNGNGTWEEQIDLIIPESGGTIIDNDLGDEDPTVGVYQMTIEGDDGPNMVSNLGLFFVAEDTGGIDDAYVYINPITSDYSVSGSITPVAANIIIMAMNDDNDLWMTTTDTSGNYQVFVQDAGMFYVMAFDALGVFNGLFADPSSYEVNVTGHLTGYDFNFVQGNCTIQGTVTNENGSPLEGLTVYANQDGPSAVWDVTDVNGFYQIAVIEGTWYIDFNSEDLMPDYMRPEQTEVEILEGNTETVDLMLYETDSFIQGTVYLDGVPVQGFEIQAWNDMVGDSYATSSTNGTYDLPVASEANAMGGYNVQLDIWNIPGIYVEEYYDNVASGSTGINFHVHTVTGGVEGYIYDSVTLEPINDSWVSAYDGMNYYSTGTDDGYYQLYLPNGTYDVWAEADMHYQQYVEDVIINDNFVILDFYLDPVIFEGSLQGTIYEEGTTNPIPFVDISVQNNVFWTGTTSDENGHYYFDMPNGTFNLNAWHPLYYGVYLENIVINNNAVTLDIEMEPVAFDGALEGFVYEEGTTNPVTYAFIEVYGNYWTSTMSDNAGFYHVDLPNGLYSLDCWKDNYFGTHVDNIEINNNTVTLNLFLTPMIEAGDILSAETKLSQNYPNPFNPSTTISFNLSNEQNEQIELIIYNLKGQKVKTLDCINRVDANARDSRATVSVTWNGEDDSGKPVSSGIYFYKLKAGDFQATRKMLLLK